MKLRLQTLTASILAILALAPPLRADELSMAVRMENPEAIAAAIKKSTSVNSPDASGRTALFYAVVTRKLTVVKSLLDAGAKASVPGQFREPLWAAAVNGDTEIISLLLEHGADPEAGVPGWRPVDAAVMSGRVNVLKMLMAAKPAMQLPEVITTYKEGENANDRILSFPPAQKGTVGDALWAGHPEMAGFIASHVLPRTVFINLKYQLLQATGFQPFVPEAAVDGLLKAGADPLASTLRQDPAEMYPETAAEVAARMGRSALLDRFLTGRKPNPTDSARLLGFADQSGDPATMEVVRRHLPDVKPFEFRRLDKAGGFLNAPEFDPRTSWDTREAGALLLAPRANAVPVALAATGGASIAVITGKDSGNEATLLAAVLSTVEGWTVVERDEVETLLAERHFDFKKPLGLVEIGDKLKADFLILLDKPGEGTDRVLRAEIVNVATGMVASRLHASIKDFKPDAWIRTLRGSISRAQEDWKTSKGRMQAITLLGVGTIPGMEGGNTVRSIVSAGLMAEIDATPGCIALTRMQMRPLVEEQTLGHPGSIWQSAWTLEAGAGRETEGGLTLRLRLKNLRSGETFDADAEGSPSRMGELVGKVWAALSSKAQFSKPRPAPAVETKAEGEVLLEEAKWRYTKGEYDAAASLADSAHYLGNDGPATQDLRIRARLEALPFTNERIDSLSARHTAEILARLPTAVEALDLMNEQFDASTQAEIHIERERIKNRVARIGRLSDWFSALVSCRAAISPKRATPEEKDDARHLDLGLQNWYAKVYPQSLAGDEAFKNALPPFDLLSILSNIDLDSVPWVSEMVAGHLTEAFVKEADLYEKNKLAGNMGSFIELVALQNNSRYPLYRPLPDIDARKQLFSKLEGITPSLLARLLKEADFLVARDARRAELAEEIADMKVAELRHGQFFEVSMVTDLMLCRYRVIENQKAQLFPSNEEMYCPDALASEGPEGELLRNLHGYSKWRRELPDRARLIRQLSIESRSAMKRETRPGATGIRARVTAAARMAGLTGPELAELLEPLPTDVKPGTRPDPTAAGAIKLLTPLASLPSGADSFIVGNVVTQPSSDFIWWSGGLVKGTFSFTSSPEFCLPALARVSLTDGKMKIVTSPSGWSGRKENSEKLIFPSSSAIHVAAGRVVWHVPKTGVFEVNPETLALIPLIPKIDKLPDSVYMASNAGAIIGDAFFVAERMSTQHNHRNASERVLCLRAGQKPVVVVETSRRPEASPLDGVNNRITVVAAAGDKLRVFANAQWGQIRSRAMMVEFSTHGVPAPLTILTDKTELNKGLWRAQIQKFPYNPRINRWTWGDGFSTQSSSKSGFLTVNKGSASHSIRIDFPPLSIPGGTYQIPELDPRSKPTGQKIIMTTSELVSSGMGYIQIIGEQDDCLLVTQRWWQYHAETPLVWRISKAYLEAQTTK